MVLVVWWDVDGDEGQQDDDGGWQSGVVRGQCCQTDTHACRG